MYKKSFFIDKQLILRELKITDAGDVFDYASDSEFCKYLSAIPYKSVEESEEFINSIISDNYNQKKVYWGIEYKSKIIGTTGYFKINDIEKYVEIGFGISKCYWGKSLINKCIKFLIQYAFEELQMIKVIIGTNIENKRAINFIKKFKFKYSETLNNREIYIMDKNEFIK